MDCARCVAAGSGPGVLEIKCPYKRGNFANFEPPATAAPLSYYLPQIQGQMDILGREWCHLVIWSPKGIGIYLVHRDQQYWEDVSAVLAWFWWEKVGGRLFLLLRLERTIALMEQN